MAWMPQRKVLVATGILVFDFELFVGGLFKKRADNSLKLPLTLNVTHPEEFKSPVSVPSSQKNHVKIPTGFGNLIES
jgi:hypothetical protein